jgi:chromosome partitioning protein
MQIVTIANAKGGTAKTTTTALLAVRAMQAGRRVVMVDLNADQANLLMWWLARGEPFNPFLEREITNITRDLRAMGASGRFDFCIIDTPPLDMDVIENCVVIADAVIVPVRTSIFDVGSVDPVVEMCREHHRPFSFLMAAVDTRFKPLNAEALAALVTEGPVFSTRISYRLPYINALSAGKTGHEIDKSLKPEADSLWTELQTLMAKSPAPAARGRAAHG